jgi:hypothetical protein
MKQAYVHRCIAVLASLSPVAACRADSGVSQGQAARALDTSSAEPTAAIWHYAIVSDGRAHVELPGVAERITADASATDGSIDLVASDLARSRGHVRVDLATLTTTTFRSDKDKTQTKHARTWLEVQVGDRTNEGMRFAEFAIRSVDVIGDSNLAALVPEEHGGEDQRKVALILHGELLIHGHKVPKDAPVGVVFHYPAGAPVGGRPTRIEIASTQPMRIVLREHDVRPRDPAGQVLEWTTSLLSKVAETADVTVQLNALPAG